MTSTSLPWSFDGARGQRKLTIKAQDLNNILKSHMSDYTAYEVMREVERLGGHFLTPDFFGNLKTKPLKPSRCVGSAKGFEWIYRSFQTEQEARDDILFGLAWKMSVWANLPDFEAQREINVGMQRIGRLTGARLVRHPYLEKFGVNHQRFEVGGLTAILEFDVNPRKIDWLPDSNFKKLDVKPLYRYIDSTGAIVAPSDKATKQPAGFELIKL